MKKILPILLVAFLALNVFGDASYEILQKAREVSTTRPTGGGPPPKPASSPSQPKPAAPTVQPASQLPAEQQLVVNALAAPNTNNVQKLSASLLGLAHGAQKPSQATLDKLALDLSLGMTGHPVAAAERARIAKDIETVFNSPSNTPPERVEAFIVDVPLLLKALGVESTYTAAIGNDLRAARKEIVAVPTPATTH